MSDGPVAIEMKTLDTAKNPTGGGGGGAPAPWASREAYVQHYVNPNDWWWTRLFDRWWWGSNWDCSGLYESWIGADGFIRDALVRGDGLILTQVTKRQKSPQQQLLQPFRAKVVQKKGQNFLVGATDEGREYGSK